MDGEYLKVVLAKYDWSGQRLAEAMDKAPRTVYEWFSKNQLKETLVERIAFVTKIPKDEFKPKTIQESTPSAGKGISLHHGRNVQNTLQAKGIKVEHLAKKMQVSRKTLYQLLKEKDWEQGRLLLAAQILQVPTAQLKGIGEGEKGFEKEIYTELVAIRKQLQELRELIKK